ncbi:unnamed protein product [Schistocephalus solidus]|uniref:P-loop containing nucleoside triphosphate hydrolase protein n=1 Tax=Schistocephalus solidus TaxID=70667 RepID=A0A183SRY9_SCHSO|nr:unnamed protein product [Schistocephalus solidus]
MAHLKIAVVGPQGSGKSYFCNFLSDAIEQSNSEYRPTKRIDNFREIERILEYDMLVPLKSKPTKVDIELWDVSGSKNYQNCWPAIFKGIHGLVLLYNVNEITHGDELEEWYM